MTERRYAGVSLIVAMLSFALLQGGAIWLAGSFEYALDDVYIHLAIAEELARGGYGVNIGEPASAASSVLYPFLLIPFAGGVAQVWLPLLWNILALIGAAIIWGVIVARTGMSRGISVALSLIGPLAFNFAGLAFTGMEHSLHMVATLSVLLGLQSFLQTGRVTIWLLAGVMFGPLIRFEGLAVSAAAVLVLLGEGRMKSGIVALALAVVPILAFMGFLTGLGLDPVPNSVHAKLAGESLQARPFHQTLLFNIARKFWFLPGFLLIAGTFAALIGALLARQNASASQKILIAAGIAGAGHVLLGKIGWMNRYEIYSVAFVFGGLLVAAGFWPKGQRHMAGIVMLASVPLAIYYSWTALDRSIYTPRAITLQQAQMERFVDEYHQGSVAVNDLGKIAHANDYYVLDLWGLASKQALDTRLSNSTDGWASELVTEKGVDLAIIYEAWLGRAIGADWVLLGRMAIKGSIGALGAREVSFYATSPDVAPALAEKLSDFSTSLPEGASIQLEEVRG